MPYFSAPFCLSTTGSTRATAYNWSNKIVTLDNKTHVVWLDAVAVVCGRTFDHTTGQWGATVRIAEGCDNHTNPSLTADREGYLRLTFGPHGWWGGWNEGRVRWLRSKHPHDLTEWTREENFGYNATGASIVHTPGGLDVVICRGGESPAQTVFHCQRPQGGWTSAQPLFHQEIEPQYTHHYGHIACDQSGKLYAACHFYNVGGGDNHPVEGEHRRMRSYGASVLCSKDMGKTWANLRGQTVVVPLSYELETAIPPWHGNIYLKGFCLDPDGCPWALTMNAGTEDEAIFLSRWTGLDWQTQRLEKYLPDQMLAVSAMMTFCDNGNLHIALTVLSPGQLGQENHWGNPKCEVVLLASVDGGHSFTFHQVSPVDGTVANWLPSISLSGPFHPVTSPTLLYTRGEPGTGCRPEDHTEVWCVRIL